VPHACLSTAVFGCAAQLQVLAIALLWLIIAGNQVTNVDGSICAGRRLSLDQLKKQLLGTGFERLALWVGGYVVPYVVHH
jgi:hypothetical protein